MHKTPLIARHVAPRNARGSMHSDFIGRHVHALVARHGKQEAARILGKPIDAVTDSDCITIAVRKLHAQAMRTQGRLRSELLTQARELQCSR